MKALQAEPGNDARGQEISVLSGLMAKPEIGKVILASGRRMTGKQHLDWALIETPKPLQ
jgi:hypothetical protein